MCEKSANKISTEALRVIGKKIRTIRETLMYSRPAFSETLGVSLTALIGYEMGPFNPDLDIIRRVCQLFHGEMRKRIVEYLVFSSGTLPEFSRSDIGHVTIPERSRSEPIRDRVDSLILTNIVRNIRVNVFKLSAPAFSQIIHVPISTIKNYEYARCAMGLEYIYTLCSLSSDNIKAFSLFVDGVKCEETVLQSLWSDIKRI